MLADKIAKAVGDESNAITTFPPEKLNLHAVAFTEFDIVQYLVHTYELLVVITAANG